MRNPKKQPIKTKPSYSTYGIELGGWFDGKQTYFGAWDTYNHHCIFWLEGQKLYRLAKAIVERFESEMS